MGYTKNVNNWKSAKKIQTVRKEKLKFKDDIIKTTFTPQSSNFRDIDIDNSMVLEDVH